jgi:hypothetical protein
MEHSIAWGGVDLVFNVRRTLGPNSGAERTRVMRDSRYAPYLAVSEGYTTSTVEQRRVLHMQQRGWKRSYDYERAGRLLEPASLLILRGS